VSFNFLSCDREQQLLLPPSLRDWLVEDHLAWFVLDAVGEIDLAAFYCEYRDDGWGRAAFAPEMMVALLLYAYAVGERSSRAIERRCREDVAFRVICANQTPDHATIARFRVRHQEAFGSVFTGVLRLCAAAGLVRVGVIAVDGTKIRANAAISSNRRYEAVSDEVTRILWEADAADAADDAEHGEARGDELPGDLRDRSSRLARLRAAKQRLDAEAADARRAYDARQAERARVEAERGRRLRGRKPKKPPAQVSPTARVNTTDPESGLMHTRQGIVQGYNAQLVATEDQIVIACDVTNIGNDQPLLAPMASLARDELAAAGVGTLPEVLVADAGYWNRPQIRQVMRAGTAALVATESRTARQHPLPRKPRAARREGLYLIMQRALDSPEGHALYTKRQQIAEPVFAHTKTIRRVDQFLRRGLDACQAEWRLAMTTHNLLKLHRAQLAR